MGKYKVVLFDLDNTLVDFTKAQEKAISVLVDKFSLPVKKEAFSKRYNAVNSSLWLQLEKGILSLEALKKRRFEELSKWFTLPVSVSELSQFFAESLSSFMEAFPEAPETCKNLKKHCRLGVVTNGFLEEQKNKLATAGLDSFFEIMITPQCIGGYCKPNAKIFGEALKMLKHLDPTTTLMVGDRITADILGGKRAGMDTCWFNPFGTVNKSQIIPTYEIRSLKEVCNCL